MSIRIRVSTSRTKSTTKSNGEPTYGSYSASAAISFEMDPALLNDAEAFVAKVRGQYALCESAMNEELQRLKAQANVITNGPAAAAAGPNPTAEVPPPKRPVAGSPVTSPPGKRAAAEPVAEDDGDEDDPQEEDNPPTSGRNLLGWARSQPTDAKNWLVGFGRKKRYPNRILDWSPIEVKIAYAAFRQAHAS